MSNYTKAPLSPYHQAIRDRLNGIPAPTPSSDIPKRLQRRYNIKRSLLKLKLDARRRAA